MSECRLVDYFKSSLTSADAKQKKWLMIPKVASRTFIRFFNILTQKPQDIILIGFGWIELDFNLGLLVNLLLRLIQSVLCMRFENEKEYYVNDFLCNWAAIYC